MKGVLSLILLSLVFLALLPNSKAWDQADFEIFDLVDELEKSEGPGVNFYSWLNIPATASQADVGKAYRKLSLQLHPDKNKDDRAAKERFARLGKVAAILRNPSGRTKYNFFYKNGVPRWRGTGYYYARFRPGLIAVVLFLVLAAGGMQHMAQWVTFYQEKRKIVRFIANARTNMASRMAKGLSIPTTGRSFVAIGGRELLCEVKSDTHIVVTTPEGDRVDLNTEEVQPPKMTDVYLISWPKRLAQKFFGPKDSNHDKTSDDEEDESKDEGLHEQGEDTSTRNKNKSKTPKKKTDTSKVGGRRRVVRK